MLLAFIPSMLAQDKVKYIDDEECGCELVFIDGIQTTQHGDRFGFKREDGTIIVPNKYMFVDKFHGEYCKVYMNYDSCGLINRDGVEIIPCLYQDVFYPTDGMIMAIKDNLYGFFDTTGSLRIPFTYRAASTFNEGLAVVAVDIDSDLVSYGYIDHEGKIVIPAQYQYAYPFYEGVAVVKDYDRYGMIDKNNREVFPIKFEILTSMFEGNLFAGDDDGLAMYNNKFKRLTKPIYTSLEGKSEGLILVSRDNKFGYLNEKGKEVIPCQYDRAGLFKDGRAYVTVAKPTSTTTASPSSKKTTATAMPTSKAAWWFTPASKTPTNSPTASLPCSSAHGDISTPRATSSSLPSSTWLPPSSGAAPK